MLGFSAGRDDDDINGDRPDRRGRGGRGGRGRGDRVFADRGAQRGGRGGRKGGKLIVDDEEFPAL